MKFYKYVQSQNGGHYKTSEETGISKFVWVYAPNKIAANRIANSAGLYFKKYGMDDCECPQCSFRWEEIEDSDQGYESIYIDTALNSLPEYNVYLHIQNAFFRIPPEEIYPTPELIYT